MAQQICLGGLVPIMRVTSKLQPATEKANLDRSLFPKFILYTRIRQVKLGNLLEAVEKEMRKESITHFKHPEKHFTIQLTQKKSSMS